MEVELRNESEMPANFNWNIPVNMEACPLVSTNHRHSTTVVRPWFLTIGPQGLECQIQPSQAGCWHSTSSTDLLLVCGLLKHVFSGCFGRDIFHPEEGKFVQ